VKNVFEGPSAVEFSHDDYLTYGRVFAKIRKSIIQHFGLENLWFTAPTFMYVRSLTPS
jgi:hypothetical protein